MTAPAPTLAPPPIRSVREWAIALAQSLLGFGAGALFFLIVLGGILIEFDDSPPEPMLLMFGMDAVIGAAVTLAAGPLRFLRPGRLNTALHLPIAAAVGISVWSAPAAAIALYRVGTRRRPVLDVTVIVLVAASSVIAMLWDSAIRGDAVGATVLTPIAVMVGVALVPLLIGRVAATRRELIASLRERAASAERERITAQREREAGTARVRAEERAALARDVHDSISHHLATIAMHAGAMTYRDDLPPERLRHIAGTVREAAQQANGELRTVLTGLRTSDGQEPLATTATLTDIVDRGRDDGQQIDLSWEGTTPQELSARDRGTVVALARILTEITVNAAKHAPGAPLEVTLAREDDLVVLTARNRVPADAVVRTGAGPGVSELSTGHGLIGVQERASLLGGGARHGVRGDVFEVEAWMPW